MSNNDTTAEKRIVEQLSFGAKTAKRVTWEAWEFTVVGPHQVEVTNASYGVEKDAHAYIVGVEERTGVPVPAECECPADKYNEEYDCKHKVALATVGGPTVLQAAVACSSSRPASSDENSPGPADRLKTDGGAVTEDPPEDTCPNGKPWCPGPEGDTLPCFECYCDREV